jgi:hypothetical protein
MKQCQKGFMLTSSEVKMRMRRNMSFIISTITIFLAILNTDVGSIFLLEVIWRKAMKTITSINGVTLLLAMCANFDVAFAMGFVVEGLKIRRFYHDLC